MEREDGKVASSGGFTRQRFLGGMRSDPLPIEEYGYTGSPPFMGIPLRLARAISIAIRILGSGPVRFRGR
jgi:hypothetical protein